MIFKYGTYAHANNEVALTISQRPVYSPRGFRQATRHTWNLVGTLHAANQSALTAAIHSLADAYGVEGKTAALYLDNGTSLTSHVLNTNQALGGVRVVSGPDFPTGEGAEYSTFRTYAITLEADFADGQQNLLDFRETIAFLGGGPRFVYLQPLVGLPQKQLVAQATPYRAIQSGYAIGHGSYVPWPGPIWPAAERRDERTETLRGPSNIRGTSMEFGADWQYVFESNTPLSAFPRTI